jgi:hypothetical protein
MAPVQPLTLVDLFAIHLHPGWCLNAKFDHAWTYREDSHTDVFIDANGLAMPAGQDQHGGSPDASEANSCT